MDANLRSVVRVGTTETSVPGLAREHRRSSPAVAGCRFSVVSRPVRMLVLRQRWSESLIVRASWAAMPIGPPYRAAAMPSSTSVEHRWKIALQVACWAQLGVLARIGLKLLFGALQMACLQKYTAVG
jgi:hypothetical protein